MKTKSKLYFILTLIFLFISCEPFIKDRNGSDNDIKLEIYAFNYAYDYGSTGDRFAPMPLFMDWEFYSSRRMKEEGEVIMKFPDDNDGYFCYAKRKGYYTEVYNFINGDTVFIDLDTVQPGKSCGVIFRYSDCQLPFYMRNAHLPVYSGGDTVYSIRTDKFGRFAVNYESEEYQMEYPENNFMGFYPAANYMDYFIDLGSDYCQMLEKPNIYIYPETDMVLDVELVFPDGGMVVKSYPQYPDGWKNIEVSPNGTIDNKFGYLFYESSNPDLFQYQEGWVVQKDDLEQFFIHNMKKTKFIQNEIDDFIEYWIPLLTDYEHYAIYPQYNRTLDKMVQLKFSKSPESLIRLIYCIKGLESSKFILNEPKIPTFKRTGFTVTEWGVVRK